MPGRGRPRRSSAATAATPTRNGDIRAMFSRQSARKAKKTVSPDASPAPAAKR